ncbi:MAG: hypothetical protein ACLPXT_01035 [Terracidiphilus sp.]
MRITEVKDMLAPSEAIDKARIYLGEVIPEFAALDPRVEEMVLDKNSANWNITFCALSSPEKSQENSLADLLRFHKIRKIVYIGADDGSLIAVRNPAPF